MQWLTRFCSHDAMCCLQFKDMVLKFSGSNKHCKGAAPAPPTFGSRNCRRPYPGFIDDTSFTPASSRVVHGEDYYTRTASTLLAATGAGSNRDWLPGGGKGPGGSSPGEEIIPVGSREWTAQVEPGVQITFVTLSGGGNDLKRIRFRYRYTCRVQRLSSLSIRNHISGRSLILAL
jgi:hypothetical protein